MNSAGGAAHPCEVGDAALDVLDGLLGLLVLREAVAQVPLVCRQVAIHRQHPLHARLVNSM